MTQLVTLAKAKSHLRVYHDDEDGGIEDTIRQASEAVMDYLKRPHDTYTDATDSTPTDAPFAVQASVLLWLAFLWENRGDSMDTPPFQDGDPPPAVKSLLYRLRDPALA